MSAPVKSLPAETVPTGLGELVEWVAKSGVHPIDAYHVAAMLEMNGWTDRRAARLGYEDVFTLAQAVHSVLRSSFHREPVLPKKRVHWLKSLLHTIRLYLRGLTFAAPMLLSSASVLTLKYSFASYVGFSTEVATGIALGTFTSFIVAGGFTQAIARRGLFYLSQNLYSLARRSSVQLMLVGVVAAALMGLLFNVFMLLVPVLPWSMVTIAGIYYVLLTFIWVGAGLLYMLQQEMIILGLVGVGIVVVGVLWELYEVPMMTAQIAAMSVIAFFSVAIGLFVLWRLERTDATVGDGDIKPITPRWSQISRSLAPYFLYGILYFAILFVDRLLAWSVPGEFHPYVIWFLGDYELGVDWALWTLVLPMGIVEVYIHVMFYRISQRQQTTTIEHVPAFNRKFLREHLYMSAIIFTSSLLSIILILGVMRWLLAIGVLPFDPMADPVTRLVFYLAAPGFGLVTVGLHNTLVLFSLNVPWPAVNATGIALVGNLIVGFLGSRYGGHQWAVLGFLTGAVLFSYLSARAAQKVFNDLDYHLLRGV